MPNQQRHVACKSCFNEMRRRGKSFKESTDQCRSVERCTKENLKFIDKRQEIYDFENHMEKRKW